MRAHLLILRLQGKEMPEGLSFTMETWTELWQQMSYSASLLDNVPTKTYSTSWLDELCVQVERGSVHVKRRPATRRGVPDDLMRRTNSVISVEFSWRRRPPNPSSRRHVPGTSDSPRGVRAESSPCRPAGCSARS